MPTHRWTEKIDGQAATIDVSENTLLQNYRTPNFENDEGEIEWMSMWWVDAAPAVGEGLGGILSLQGKDFHHTIELPMPTGGAHLAAIGARSLTPMQQWFVNIPLDGGEFFDIVLESIDTVAANGRAGVTFGYMDGRSGLPVIESKMARETQITLAGETPLVDIEFQGISKVVEGIGVIIPSGTVTADIEIAGGFRVKSTAFRPTREFSWDINPWPAMEATSGQLNQAAHFRPPQDLDVISKSPTVSAWFDLDVALTTQTSEAIWGLRYIGV